ncbi:hypothetical protein CspeluHIS016_0406050 [Cutaneotrichosporon spelunceum]|uniref:Uncharacterized protein n=1 Tax=Cutaneotrichosporon spelunceum TaxID=1672016 RepID=A0AAD3YC76_9TREE|nr:hypothetical protein CspeluHIS016_0406050 [Cutaneotrichosporon spelunceum]
MLGLKKKLSALVPSDTRGTLQKALTVEWDTGHKAVLVDLSPGRERRDTEMSSASAPSKYGRLPDEDEEEALFRAWDAAEVERKTAREKEERTRRMVAEALGAPRKAESVLGLDKLGAFNQDRPPTPEKESRDRREKRRNLFVPLRPDDGALVRKHEGSGRSPASSRSGSRSSADAAHPDNPFR